MNLHTLSPYIRCAFDHTLPRDWHLPERVIFDYELLYVKEGEAEVTVEDRTYRGVAGDLFLFKPRQRHSIRSVGNVPFRQPHIHFDLFYRDDSPEVKVCFRPLHELTEHEKRWFRPDVCSALPFQLPNHIRLRNPLTIEKMIFDIIREMEQKLPYYETNAKGLFVQLWVHLLRELYWMENSHITSNWETLAAIKRYLAGNLDREVSVDEMARMANMSKYYFIRTFRRAFGMTPFKYHQSLRIEKAKQLIQFTSEPITQIAERLGYPGIHAFSRAFRQIEGVAPSFYRQKKS